MDTTSNPLPLIKQGWLRALLFLVGILAIAILVPPLVGNAVSSLVKNPQYEFMLMYTILAVLMVGLAWLMRRFIDRKSFMSMGFQWKEYKSDGGMGLFTAIAMLGIGTLVLVFAKKLQFTSVEFDPLALTLQLLMMTVVAFTEEIAFRGYILNNLMNSMNKYLALAISAVVFGFVHASNPNVTMLPIANVVLAGLLIGSNYIFTRNLWFAILFHLAWNFLQGPVLGYPVSGLEVQTLLQQYQSGTDLWTGGKFGFEGSFLCTMLLLMVTLVWLLFFNKKYSNVGVPTNDEG